MFATPNLYCMVQNFTGIRIKDERENDRNLLVEFAFETPLTVALAEDVDPKLIGDLFDETTDGFIPKKEMNLIRLTMSPGRQIVTLRPHPDMDHFARVVGVAVKNINVKKAAKLEQWLLSFVMTFPLQDDLMIGLVRTIKTGVHMTCELMSPDLFKDAVDDVTVSGSDEAGTGKVGRRRGRKPKTIEGEVVKKPASQPALGDGSEVGDEQPGDTDGNV